nr:MAG TPA: hypothetical protein [Caudoviricetes sp.]
MVHAQSREVLIGYNLQVKLLCQCLGLQHTLHNISA